MRQTRSRRHSCPPPDLSWETVFISQGYHLIAGIDEAGRGCLAGPLVAGAVILAPEALPPWMGEVTDSKLLTPAQRERLCLLIEKAAVATGLGIVSAETIDRYGMTCATRLAMSEAVSNLSPAPEGLLIDFFKIPELTLPQISIVDGDRKCLSIACASIVAKVRRDHMMEELDAIYPGYRLSQNKGYPTPEHLRSLKERGPSPIHRLSFAPVKAVIR